MGMALALAVGVCITKRALHNIRLRKSKSIILNQ